MAFSSETKFVGHGNPNWFTRNIIRPIQTKYLFWKAGLNWKDALFKAKYFKNSEEASKFITKLRKSAHPVPVDPHTAGATIWKNQTAFNPSGGVLGPDDFDGIDLIALTEFAFTGKASVNGKVLQVSKGFRFGTARHEFFHALGEYDEEIPRWIGLVTPGQSAEDLAIRQNFR